MAAAPMAITAPTTTAPTPTRVWYSGCGVVSTTSGAEGAAPGTVAVGWPATALEEESDMAGLPGSDHAGLVHDRAQRRELGVDEVLEGLAGQHGRRPAVLLQRLGPGLGLGRLDDHVDQHLTLLRRDAGRAVDAAPVADLDVVAELLHRRDVQALDALRRGDGDRAHLAALDVGLELAVAAAADGDVAAQDRGHRLAAAAEGDVVDLGRVDADLAGQHGRGDVLGGAARTAAPLHRAGILLQRLDHVLH